MNDYNLRAISHLLREGNCDTVVCSFPSSLNIARYGNAYSFCSCPLAYICDKDSLRTDFNRRLKKMIEVWMNDNEVTKADLLPYLF